MGVRIFVVALLASALSAGASAQERGGFLGPFKPGMTVAEAQAAQPGWEIRPSNLHLEEAYIPSVHWSGGDYTFSLDFQRGRLFSMGAWRSFPIAAEGECRQAFDVLLADMERQFGPLDGASDRVIGETRLAPSGSRITESPQGRARTLSAYKRASVSASASWSRRTSREGVEELICVTQAVATATGDVLEAIVPAAPLPEDIAAARPIDAPPRLAAGADVSRFYPGRAMMNEVTGRVELECLALAGGALRCAVSRETPPDFGFGEAALRVAAAARVDETFQGEPTLGRRVHVLIPFRLAD